MIFQQAHTSVESLTTVCTDANPCSTVEVKETSTASSGCTLSNVSISTCWPISIALSNVMFFYTQEQAAGEYNYQQGSTIISREYNSVQLSAGEYNSVQQGSTIQYSRGVQFSTVISRGVQFSTVISRGVQFSTVISRGVQFSTVISRGVQFSTVISRGVQFSTVISRGVQFSTVISRGVKFSTVISRRKLPRMAITE